LKIQGPTESFSVILDSNDFTWKQPISPTLKEKEPQIGRPNDWYRSKKVRVLTGEAAPCSHFQTVPNDFPEILDRSTPNTCFPP
jgi:hypothetical protein